MAVFNIQYYDLFHFIQQAILWLYRHMTFFVVVDMLYYKLFPFVFVPTFNNITVFMMHCAFFDISTLF